MGSDNLHSKHKAKKLKDHSRLLAKVKPYDRVLIVCEGEKTEPYYFRGLRNEYKLDVTNVEITGDCDSDPLKIVQFAKQKYKDAKDKGNPFDKVYCVFDKDSHINYQGAINMVSSLKPRNTFFAINSVPCFEYWLLLHFVYTTKAFTASGKNSVAYNVIRDLKTYLPNYAKGQKDIFNCLKPSLTTAIQKASRANTQALNSSTDNPTTKVVELVEYLINLKK